jgi:hypothetical protein
MFSFGVPSAAIGRKDGKKMKTKLIAVMLVAGASAFAQGQFGGDMNRDGAGYDNAQDGPGYGAPPYNGASDYYDAQTNGGALGYYPQGPAGAYAAPPLCAPGTVWIDGYNGVNGYCAVPPYSGAYWIAPGYFGGRFVAGYWGGPRGFAGGRVFRGGAGFAGHSDFHGGAVGGRAFAGNNFRRGAIGGQSFAGNNSYRGGAVGARSFNSGSNYRGGAPSLRSSGGFSRGGGARSSDGGHSVRGHR